MKANAKKLVMSLLTGAMIISGSVALAADNQHGSMMSTSQSSMHRDTNLMNYAHEQNDSMNSMMENMKAITPTESASVDFLEGMIPHHQAAIDMSKSVLKYGGNNADVKQIAEDVIRVQTQEIAQMKVMIQEMKNTSKDKVKAQAYMKEYHAMLNSSTHNMNSMMSSQNVDSAFVTGMIAHHETAIEMSKIILKYSDSDKIKAMAQNIIDVQLREISHMKLLLESGTLS